MSEGPDTWLKAPILGRRPQYLAGDNTRPQYLGKGPSPGNAGYIPLVFNKLCSQTYAYMTSQFLEEEAGISLTYFN